MIRFEQCFAFCIAFFKKQNKEEANPTHTNQNAVCMQLGMLDVSHKTDFIDFLLQFYIICCVVFLRKHLWETMQ